MCQFLAQKVNHKVKVTGRPKGLSKMTLSYDTHIWRSLHVYLRLTDRALTGRRLRPLYTKRVFRMGGRPHVHVGTRRGDIFECFWLWKQQSSLLYYIVFRIFSMNEIHVLIITEICTGVSLSFMLLLLDRRLRNNDPTRYEMMSLLRRRRCLLSVT